MADDSNPRDPHAVPAGQSLFQSAKVLKKEFHGLSPHQLRIKIASRDRTIAELSTENAKLNQVVTGYKLKFSSIDTTRELHQHNVVLERENRALQAALDSIRKTLNTAPLGSWVIGNVGDLPDNLQPHFGLLNDVQAAVGDRKALETAASGFTALWRRVADTEKRRVIAECEREGLKHIGKALETAAHIAATQTEEADPTVRAKAEGRIQTFARKEDRF